VEGKREGEEGKRTAAVAVAAVAAAGDLI